MYVCTIVCKAKPLFYKKYIFFLHKCKNNKKIYASVANQKITMSLYEFSNFWFFNFFSLLIHTSKSKNVSGVKIYGRFSFFWAIKNKKIVKNIFVNSGYFKKIHKSFQFFPYYCLKTFVVRGGSI